MTVSQVLVVEDDTLQRALLIESLQAEAYAVFGVGSAEEALERLERVSVDVAVVDVHLPGLSGVELLRAVRRASPRTEVVMVTARPSVEAAVSCLRAGAFDFLVKPIETSVLETSVARALDHGMLQWRTAIYEVCQRLLACPDPETIPTRIVRAACEALNADEASLLVPQGDGKLAIVASTSLDPGIVAKVRLAIGERVAGRVAQDRKPALLPERLADDPRFTGMDGHGRVASSIVHPLVSGGELRGVLTLGRHAGSRPFRGVDLEWTAVLADPVTSALDQAALLRRLVTGERLAVIGQLTTALGHEINNVLAFVLSNLDYIDDALGETATGQPADLDPDERRELFAASREAADGGRLLRQLVSDMRLLARGEDGAVTRLPLREAIESAVRLAAARREATIEIDAEEALWVNGRSGLLVQLFLNLLVNAEQAMRAAGVSDRRVGIRCRRQGGWIVSEVVDSGPGVPDELRRRVFEPFFTTKPPGEGTGLGLSLCMDIAARHGGSLELAESGGPGATFVVTLPAADEGTERAAG